MHAPHRAPPGAADARGFDRIRAHSLQGDSLARSVEALVEHLDARDAVQPLASARDFFTNAETLRSAQHDVEAAVVAPLCFFDHARAPDREERRVACDLGGALRQHRRHPDHACACERGGRHLSVARLEDVQRTQDAREENDVRERKDRDRIRRECCVVHARQLNKPSAPLDARVVEARRRRQRSRSNSRCPDAWSDRDWIERRVAAPG